MTDDELAGKLEWNAKHGSHAFPPLLYAAAERIYALSAHVALLKASLAKAEREAEKATASAELFGYFRVTHFGWEDCAATDDGAIPLYSAPQLDRVAELESEVERLRGLLSGLVDDIQGLMSESDGVAGLHLNGDVAPWSELEAGARFERLTHLPEAALAGKEAQS